MKKYLLSSLFIVAFVLYSGYQHFHPPKTSIIDMAQPAAPGATTNSLATQTAPAPVAPSAGSPTASAPPVARQPAAPASAPPPAAPSAPVPPAGKSGTYTGGVVDAYYGYVQVKTTLSGGKITDVQFLQYPNDRRQSELISSVAVPRLRSEALAAQSANVDIVSGATLTSEAFIQSLRSALAQV